MGGLEVVLAAGGLCGVLAWQFNRPLRAQRRAARRRRPRMDAKTP